MSRSVSELPIVVLDTLMATAQRLVVDRRGSTVWDVKSDRGHYAVKLGHPIEGTADRPAQPLDRARPRTRGGRTASSTSLLPEAGTYPLGDLIDTMLSPVPATDPRSKRSVRHCAKPRLPAAIVPKRPRRGGGRLTRLLYVDAARP